MTGNKIYNNTHFSSSNITAPYVIKIMQKPVPDNYVYNNIFFNQGVSTSIFETTDMKFDYNCYYGYATIPGGEHSIIADPLMVNPGTAPIDNTITPTVDSLRAHVAGYKLQSASPCINKGVDISTLWPGEVTGVTDLWGNELYDGAIDIGANNVPTILDLLRIIYDMKLPKGTENSLIVSLDNAEEMIDRGHINTATNLLKAFINKIESSQGKDLSNQQVDQLILEAQKVINYIKY